MHVLASLDRSTMGTDGATCTSTASRSTWCQHIGGGRSYTTAWGHFDEVFTDVDVVDGDRPGRALGRRAAARPTARSRACTARLQAEDADVIGGAEKQSSPFDGANQVVTRIQHDGYLLFRDLDLTDVKSVKVAAAPETAPTPSPYSLPQATPALGGTVSVVLDDLTYDNQALGGSGATYEVAGSAELSPTRPPTTPLDGAATGNPAGYDALEIPIDAPGRHDVYVVFTNGTVSGFNPFRVLAPTVQESMLLGSVDWVEFPGLRVAGRDAERGGPSPSPSAGAEPDPGAGATGREPRRRRAPARFAARHAPAQARRVALGGHAALPRAEPSRGAPGSPRRSPARAARLAAGRARVRSGTTKLTLRLTARARTLLRRSRRLTGRLALTITTPDGARTAKARRVTVTARR